MVENSKIEWTDHTFNPWMGCTKISPACDHCYAEAQTGRFKQVGWGPHAPRKRTSPQNWGQPLIWNRKAKEAGVSAKVFCASLADVFDNHRSIEDQWRQELWQLIKQTPHLDWLLLTKRPQNIEVYAPEAWGMAGEWPKNVWLGTTVENQQEAKRRIPELLRHNAAKRFLSCEPLLEEIDITDWLWGRLESLCDGCPKDADCECSYELRKDIPYLNPIDWVICGGESGADSRPMSGDWVRSLKGQCNDAEVPFLFKQWGNWIPGDQAYFLGDEIDGCAFGCFNDAGVWCPNVSRDWPNAGREILFRMSKTKTGRTLDGVTCDEMPS